MPDSAPNPELLHSLGRLARGLSALFWGLPAALIICLGTVGAGWFKGLWGMTPALAATGLLCYGLWQMGAFQKQERLWRNVLDRARLLGLVNFGLSPFLYWWARMPDEPFFMWAVCILALSGLLFLFDVNLVLHRLGAMLPDETLRHEPKQFTALNRGLLVAFLLAGMIYVWLARMETLSPEIEFILFWLNQRGVWLLFVIVLLLLPMAVTMALIWKTKEVILEGVFGPN